MKTYALPTPVDGRSTWQDGKRRAWMLGLVVPVLPLLAVALHTVVDLAAVLWLGPVVLLVIVPVIDLFAGHDPTNPPEEVMEQLEADRYYRWVTYLYLPLQYVGFVVAMYAIATAGYGVWGNIGLSLTLGTVSGVAINTAHELGHKKDELERWLGKIALAQCFYGHFYIEHNRGHHVRVATPDDPASARMGESFYRFWPRTVLGSLTSAWEVEAKRFARKQSHPFKINNDVLNAWLMTVVLWGALLVWLGLGIAPYLIVQAVFGFTLLELVNYMEHYGLLRQKVGSGDRVRFERVLPEHSWNSNNIATNVLLYHLQRHSDHHANPTRRFQTLRDFTEAPVLPTGYTGMMVVACIPPVFRKLMDQRVVEHYSGDLRRANVQPGKLDKLLKKYPLPAEPLVTADLPVDLVEAPPADVLAARCPGCSYTYRVEAGNELEGFPAGTAWTDIPDDWTCPDCGVRDKIDFRPLERVEA
ncbi:MAG: alkane 1-monooxygenase [Frankiales bacterium]|jgi:alkane 1-monooxygenase|nr:alkane 1-monooxygenase [Frankiales bacterium]